ncbi:MAG: arginine--tRNA ligase [Ruminococcaceae bacterium]|nr:arginine--tRNA ligase [Oscillospiraceae bacterium]
MFYAKKQTANLIASALAELGVTEGFDENSIVTMLEYPPSPENGDLAFPCFRLSRTLRKAPPMIASDIKAKLSAGGLFEKIEQAGGYLNFYFDKTVFSDVIIKEICDKKEKYGSSDEGKGKTVVLDYSSPNICKPFHIGHLGSTVIGHSIKKIHEFSGYNCVGINYLGDWGTQFGKLMVAYRKWGNKEDVEKGGIDVLVDLYVRINHEIDGDPEHGIEGNKELADEARAEFHKLELGDPDNIELWKWFKEISLAEYEKTYAQLGITFDSYLGESFYTDKMPAQVQKLREANLLKIDDGASIVDLSDYKMPPCLILRSDGSTLYPTRDIAAAVYRHDTYDFAKCVYVTSDQQILHFKQWFKVVEMMGYDWADKLVHIPYGTISVAGVKLSTRHGNVLLLRDVFGQAVDKVRSVIEEKNPDLENKDEVAEAVGIGAIIYYYLLGSIGKSSSFVMDDALSFDGNTGPYAQYTYARTCSILAKAKQNGVSYGAADVKITSDEEFALAKQLALFPEKVKAALDGYEPSVITHYIFDAATQFNRFYHNCPVLTAEDPDTVKTRLMLTESAGHVLKSAFSLICMKAPEKV